MDRFDIHVVSAPAVEPVTAADVKLYTHVDDSEEDALINIWIKAGRIAAENYQHRSYIQQTLQLIFDDYPKEPFYLPRPPAISVDSIKIYETDDTATTLSSSTLYRADTDGDPGRVALRYGEVWPSTTLRTLGGFVVEYKAGYGTTAASVPDRVREAIMVYVAGRYEVRTGEQVSGYTQGFRPMDKYMSAFESLLADDRVTITDLQCKALNV